MFKSMPAGEICLDGLWSFNGEMCLLCAQVLISMVYLPNAMPASFQATYTPVESAGTDAQIKHLARLMATQITAAGLGPGGEQQTGCPHSLMRHTHVL